MRKRSSAEARDGEVALDPAARVQHLRVGDRADVARNAVVAEALEEVGRALAHDVELGEGCLVEERRGLAAGAMLGADRGRPDLAPPSRAGATTRRRAGVRLEPVRALPAGLLAEGRAELRQARVGRREAKRPARLALLARVLDVVVGRVHLDRARERVLAARVVPRRSGASPSPRRPGSATPSTIHSATSCPIPPAPASPCAQNPAATQKPRTSDSPRMNSPSGVNASGPLMSLHDLGLLERRARARQRSSSAPRSAPSPRAAACR